MCRRGRKVLSTPCLRRNRFGHILEPPKAEGHGKWTSYSMPRSRTSSAGLFSKFIERWADKGREGDRAQARSPDNQLHEGKRDETWVLLTFGNYPNAEVERRIL